MYWLNDQFIFSEGLVSRVVPGDVTAESIFGRAVFGTILAIVSFASDVFGLHMLKHATPVLDSIITHCAPPQETPVCRYLLQHLHLYHS